ncbi:TlpA disulfide reductase family protein [Nocardioides sp. YIM 152315]|uniref:TlpA disulfide reductase family protein n=1 Tax=Nocardioides sp. YIM 152315 TaxID=3031760 RepID=UPI0023DC8EF2|nr:TlpA disulfide reductase family protein [Nocardioides sp. YIM 152315]MDF1606134.1 TlpA disulfide reductase family protein [Nocardioides sp. YIM 152315]
MRPLRAGVAAPLLLALLLPGLGACTSLGSTGDKGFISGDGSVRVIDAADRDEPVSFEGESLTGEPLSSQDYLGKVLVVNRWWSGCDPCRVEMPMLSEVEAELGDKASVLGVNIRDSSPANGLAFMEGVGAEFPSIYDTKGRTGLAFAGKVPLASTPTTIVLDAEGRVAAVIAGEIPSKQTVIDVVDEIADDGTADG